MKDRLSRIHSQLGFVVDDLRSSKLNSRRKSRDFVTQAETRASCLRAEFYELIEQLADAESDESGDPR